MASNAKRYGLEAKDNLELELRLRRIEQKLETLAGTGDLVETSGGTKRTTNVPQVTGLRVLGSTPGAITLAWTQVRISDLRRYELDIAEDLAFTTNKQTFNVAGTEYQFSTVSTSGGGGNTIIYARVRARNRAGTPGPYSITLNTTTGQAQSEDIADGAVTSEKVDETDPIQFAGLNDEDVGSKLALYGNKYGLTLSNNTDDSDHDIDIAVGIARDFTNVSSINLTSGLTKRIDDNWALGDGNGGLPSTVSLANDTWYLVFLISDADGTTVDVGFDTSLTASNLLTASGLSLYRKIGAVRTDGSSNLYQFTQLLNEFIWDVPKQDVSLANPTTNEVTHTLDFVPSGYELFANATIVFHNGTSPGVPTNFLYCYGGGNTTLPAPSSSFNDVSAIGDQRGGAIHDRILTNTSAQIKTRQSASSASYYVFIQVHGWIDPF